MGPNFVNIFGRRNLNVCEVFEFGALSCGSLVALFSAACFLGPGYYFEGVAFRGFPAGIPKVQ